jgi:integrase
VTGLLNSHVKADRVERQQTKTSGRVCTPITKAIRAALDGAKRAGTGPSCLVFTNPHTGKPFTDKALLGAIKRSAAAERMPFEPTIKLLRASFGTWLAENGASPVLLAEMMGHTDPKMTFRYYVKAGFDRAKTFMDRLEDTENAGTAGTE